MLLAVVWPTIGFDPRLELCSMQAPGPVLYSGVLVSIRGGASQTLPRKRFKCRSSPRRALGGRWSKRDSVPAGETSGRCVGLPSQFGRVRLSFPALGECWEHSAAQAVRFCSSPGTDRPRGKGAHPTLWSCPEWTKARTVRGQVDILVVPGSNPGSFTSGKACSKFQGGDWPWHGRCGGFDSLPFHHFKWDRMFQGGDLALQAGCGGFDSARFHYLSSRVRPKGSGVTCRS